MLFAWGCHICQFIKYVCLSASCSFAHCSELFIYWFTFCLTAQSVRYFERVSDSFRLLWTVAPLTGSQLGLKKLSDLYPPPSLEKSLSLKTLLQWKDWYVRVRNFFNYSRTFTNGHCSSTERSHFFVSIDTLPPYLNPSALQRPLTFVHPAG